MTCYIIYNHVAKLCILRWLFPYESVKRLTFHILPFENGSPFLLLWQNIKIRTLALITLLHEYMHSVCPAY